MFFPEREIKFTWAKGTVFFFSRKSSWAIHSFKKPKFLFFFPRRWKKKYNLFFFSSVFFFSLLEKFTCHSFIRFQSSFFFWGPEKKNRFFIQSIHFNQKSSKNELCRGKKNTVPLTYLYNLLRIISWKLSLGQWYIKE